MRDATMAAGLMLFFLTSKRINLEVIKIIFILKYTKQIRQAQTKRHCFSFQSASPGFRKIIPLL